MGEFAIVEMGCDSCSKGVYIFFGELPDIKEEFIPEVTEVFFGFYGC